MNQFQAFIMPKQVTEIEKAMFYSNIATLFKCAFTISDTCPL